MDEPFALFRGILQNKGERFKKLCAGEALPVREGRAPLQDCSSASPIGFPALS